MKQEPISCRADNALAARCQSFAARWACVLKRPIFYLAAYIDNNEYLKNQFAYWEDGKDLIWRLLIKLSKYLGSIAEHSHDCQNTFPIEADL